MASITKVKTFSLFWLGFLFTGLALLQLALIRRDGDLFIFMPLLVWGACGGVAAYLLHVRRPPGDPILLPLTFFLSGLGLALIERLAPAFVTRQLFWLVIGTGLLLAAALLPHNLNWLSRHKYIWLSGGLVVLAATLVFGVNPSGFGARLWLQLGSFYFQPSEPLKLFLVIFLAAYLAGRRRELVEIPAYLGPVPLPHPSYFGPMFVMWGISIILLIWQRDLGAALLFFGTFVAMLYAATGQRRYVGVGILLLIGAGVIGYYLFDVVRLRVEAFWNPWLDPAGRSFQIVQSILAFASGGFWGQGLGQGLPTAIPVVHTDFVFAAIGEEYGLVGTVAIVLCFVLLISRGFVIGLRAQDSFEQLLAIGIALMLGLQTLVIMLGTLKLMPLTGVTLPLVSYGGSSLVTTYLMIGLLIFVANKEMRGRDDGRRMTNDERRARDTVDDTDYAIRNTQYAIRNTRHTPVRSLSVGRTTPQREASPYLRLALALFTGFCLVAGGLVFWQIVLAPFLVAREDNPRPIIEEQQIRRGRLLTADGIPVAETVIGRDGLAERRYPYPSLASVTGYYSLRYGVGGTEATFDPILRGTAGRTAEESWRDDLLHRPLTGQDVTLTIDLPAQVAADVALGDREGAVVVMDLNTGAILVMSSHPTYDPNLLDEQWDTLRRDERAPLLNRATQGLFPVGDLARLVGLIGLYEAGAKIPPDPTTAPLEEMLAPLGGAGYLATAHQLGFSRPIAGVRSEIGRLPDFDGRKTWRDLAVTPLHLARVVAALELAGQQPAPVLSPASQGEPRQTMRPATARRVRGLLTAVDEQVIGLAGQATPLETGRGYLSWFVGLAPTTASTEGLISAGETRDLILDPAQITPTPLPGPPTPRLHDEPARYVVVAVVVTGTSKPETARRVGLAPLRVLLEQEP